VKIYFDTHVVLAAFAAFATRGVCADLFAHGLLEHELLVGEAVIRELRSKLRTKLKLPKTGIDEIEALLLNQVVVSTPTEHLNLNISDPDDEWVVAEAMAGDADVLVTGDASLQKLGKRAPLPIVSPRGLWDVLRRTEPHRQLSPREFNEAALGSSASIPCPRARGCGSDTDTAPGIA